MTGVFASIKMINRHQRRDVYSMKLCVSLNELGKATLCVVFCGDLLYRTLC